MKFRDAVRHVLCDCRQKIIPRGITLRDQGKDMVH